MQYRKDTTRVCVLSGMHTLGQDLKLFLFVSSFFQIKQKPNLVSLCIKEKLFRNLVIVFMFHLFAPLTLLLKAT